MTWTVFEHNHGENETDDLAPGRGGYKYVLVPTRLVEAVGWWEETFEKEPGRMEMPYPESAVEQAWVVEEYQRDERARAHCGELELDQGGIGSPMKRLYTWNELHGRLDVWVVDEDEV